MSLDSNDNAGHEHPVPQLSGKAQAAQETLREAAAAYSQVVERVLGDPRGPFIAELREAEERVGEAAAAYALAFVGGEMDHDPDR
ncbi:MAG: hypothetical protein ABSE47_13950 [Acidimicrobiales bacterium]|jgi:hypothetical protein